MQEVGKIVGIGVSDALRADMRTGFRCASLAERVRLCGRTSKNKSTSYEVLFVLKCVDKKDATNLCNHKEIDNHYFRYK